MHGVDLIQGALGAIPLAEAAAGEAEGAGLSFNLFWILVSAANFAFFIIVLRTVALGPIMKMLDERRERIERGLRDAAEATVAPTPIARTAATTSVTASHLVLFFISFPPPSFLWFIDLNYHAR